MRKPRKNVVLTIAIPFNKTIGTYADIVLRVYTFK